jgi:ferredoxin--NADP+ reductase
VRHARELVYQEELKKHARLHYVPFVSRESVPGALQGRIPAAIRDGRLEGAAGLAIAPESAQIMLCGNPEMLKDTQAVLAERGLRKHRRRAPGHITVESFW